MGRRSETLGKGADALNSRDPSFRQRTSTEAVSRRSMSGRTSVGGSNGASGGSRPRFNDTMRKPSMRFGRAGASIRETSDGNGSGGSLDADEADREDREKGRAATSREHERRRESSVDEKEKDAATRQRHHQQDRRSPDSGTGRDGGGADTSQERRESSSRRKSRSAKNDSRGARRGSGAAVAGPVPSMTDAALKDMIEASLNEERTARAPMLRSSTSPDQSPLRVVLMGRVIIPSSKGTSLPVGSNGRDKPRMEERSHSAGSFWSGSVKDVTVHPGPEGLEVAETTVSSNRSWSMKTLSGVEKREKESASFTLLFESGRSSTSTAVGHESSYTWEGVSAAACDEILWGLLTLNRAMRDTEGLEPVNVSLKELDATAVYHGLATKHPLVPKLARQLRADERAVGQRGSSTGHGPDGDGDLPGSRRSSAGMGGRRGSEVSRGSVGRGRRSSKGSTRWDYEEFEQGEAVLGRLKWLEKGREGLLEELSEELDGLESGTIQQLIAWSEKTDETETLISLLDEVDAQLQVMEGWLEEHGRPLEAMQVDMAQIERKNNKLDVQWRNYQNLHEYLNNLVNAISISPSDESMLRNPQTLLDMALTSGDDDPAQAVEKVVASAEALSTALASTEQLAGHETTSSLQLLADQRAKLLGLAEVTCSQLVGFCRRLLKRLATQEGATDIDGGSSVGRHNPLAGDASNQRLLQAQRQFHGYLIDYEPIFAQVRKLDRAEGRRNAELQQAYGEDLSQGLLKARIRAYFNELHPRIAFNHHVHPGLASMERSSNGDGSEPFSDVITPALSAGQLTPVAAMKMCLEHTMPAIVREEAFFATLFGLKPKKDPLAKDAVHRILDIGFSELKTNYKRLASDVGDNPFDTLGVLALVEEAQSKQVDVVSLGILMEFKGLLMQRFSRFIEEQALWIQGQRGEAKKAGILAAVAKVPTLLKKLQAAADAAVDSKGKGKRQGGEAQKAYQKLVVYLFKHIEDVASSNPKYEHMVRLENYHFFSATVRPLKVQMLEEYVVQAERLEELATTRYLEWLVGYQFPALTQFFGRVEDLVTTVGAGDVTYHEPRRNLEAVLKKQGDMKVLSEGLRATHQRMVKHVAREGRLLEPLWGKLSDTLFAMFSRYEELCTLCYQHTLDPGAVDVKRAATEIGGGGPPSRNRTSPKPGSMDDAEEDRGGIDSPASSLGGGGFGSGGGYGSFSSLTSPSKGRDSGGSGFGHFRRPSSGSGTGVGAGRLSGVTSGNSSPSGDGAWSPKGSGSGQSPVNRGKQFFKNLRMT